MLGTNIGDTVGSTREHQHIKTEDLEQLSKESSQKHEALQARTRDRIRGSLMAGAAGDALGYTVEFMSRNSIPGALWQQGHHAVRTFRRRPGTGER